MGPGTQDMTTSAAMSEDQARACIAHGIEIVEELREAGLDLVATGDMGIGNTTAAAAITAVCTEADAAEAELASFRDEFATQKAECDSLGAFKAELDAAGAGAAAAAGASA